ncbi:UvrD-helicase domain-containing protein [Roseixanthobacter liquoris]|uniref:UvrD-helicase domain-containing protein n=1 Tax=Roseixanthobacter liquoris TaxID=3119921 RepID=UPI00372A3E1D
MADPLETLIQEDDVRWASELMGLGPNGFEPAAGDDSRLRAMLNLETADYEACPGSGKTTLLVAKLAILAMKWPHRRQGICVLSHTNAARNEIGSRLSSSAAGVALLRYPHFVGTIHSFVNEYLAVPWLRSKGNPVRAVDTQIALSKRIASLAGNWRTALKARGLNEYALMYEATDYTGDTNKGSLGRATPFYKALVEQSRKSSEEGYFCFDEMFVWANELLDTFPEIAKDLRIRFPLVYIDEAQDNSEQQSAILHRIFCVGEGASRRQRFGDSNQAIYSRSGQTGASTDPFPSEQKHDIPRSYRFPQIIADEVKRFGVVPQQLVGAGPTTIRVKSAAKQPVVFLFDDQSVREVLPRYGAHLLDSFNEDELAVGTFAAVAGVHELEEENPIPRAMGHYAPTYDASCARKDSAPSTFAQYLAKARFEMGGLGNTHVLVNALASALFRMSELAGSSRTSFSRKSPHKRLIEALNGSAAHADYLKLVELTLQARGEFDAAHWTAEGHPLAQSITAQLTNNAALTKEAKEFLSWQPQTVLDGAENAFKPRTDNLFSYPHADPKVHVRLGSIHSVKGETHTATLVLDTYFHKHHLSELKPWLLGVRSGGFTTKKKVPVLEGPRLLGRLKLHYVAMTRPSHLLCLAMRKDAFERGELDILRNRGWHIVDCCPAVGG